LIDTFSVSVLFIRHGRSDSNLFESPFFVNRSYITSVCHFEERDIRWHFDSSSVGMTKGGTIEPPFLSFVNQIISQVFVMSGTEMREDIRWQFTDSSFGRNDKGEPNRPSFLLSTRSYITNVCHVEERDICKAFTDSSFGRNDKRSDTSTSCAIKLKKPGCKAQTFSKLFALFIY
jgi:hypothetical protein